jgi:hypothetical protein
LYLSLQAIVWLCLMLLAANFSRFRRRIQQIEPKEVTILGSSAGPEQKIDMAWR